MRVRAKRNRHKGAQVVQPDSEEIWIYASSLSIGIESAPRNPHWHSPFTVVMDDKLF